MSEKAVPAKLPQMPKSNFNKKAFIKAARELAEALEKEKAQKGA